MIVIDEQQMSQEDYLGLIKYLEATQTEFREGSLYTIQDNYRVEHVVYGGSYPEELLDRYGEMTLNRVNQLVERGIIYDNGLQDKIEREVEQVIRTYEALDTYGMDELYTLLEHAKADEASPSGYRKFAGKSYVVELTPTGSIESYYAKDIGYLSNRLIHEELKNRGN